MEAFKKIKINLIDINKNMTDAWERFLGNASNVRIYNQSFDSFLNTHHDVEAIVSPANSFGIMTGGYDKAIIDYFGDRIMKDVQIYIQLNYYNEQPVGTAFTIPIYNNPSAKYLIHCPTMRTPMTIKDPTVIYNCMRSTLIECHRNNINSVLIPAFGACTGRVNFLEVANMMRLAYEQLINSSEKINWNTVLRF